MRRGELFDLTELRTPLSPDQKNAALHRIVEAARLRVRYTYTIKEACGILAVSRDVMDRLIRFYCIDAIVLETIYRIPWYALAEYILDQDDDDLTEALDEYIQSRHRTT